MVGDDPQVEAAFGDRLRDAYDELAQIPAEGRLRFVDEYCAEDLELRQVLLAMLAHIDGAKPDLRPPDAEVISDILDWASTNPEQPRPRLEDLEGTTLADRYRLVRIVGSGGAGVVYEARDRLLNSKAAVKLIHNRNIGRRDERRWEAAMLRQLRLPGVVQLLDEGEHGLLAYLVMDLVEGEPFPGRATGAAWSQIERSGLALLETLDLVHRAGIVHGDLKPGNVLVDAAGRPYILDLGLAQSPANTSADRSPTALRGTPGYMAPEQLRGERAAVRSDLFAVGVMLHESLTGKPYRTEASVRLARFGLAQPGAKPLDDLIGDVPAPVRDAILSMVEYDPDSRPASVRDVLEVLYQHGTKDVGRPELRFVGRKAQLDALMETVRSGATVAIAGPPGSGRTRLIRECERRLSSKGYRFEWGAGRVVSVHAGTAPAADSLLHIVEHESGPSIRLSPLTEFELRSLFSGPDRLLHLREDAAHELWLRTGGLPNAVVQELESWSRAGLGWARRGVYHIRRRDLDVLARGYRRVPPPRSSTSCCAPYSDDVWRFALAAELAGPLATPSHVAMALGRTSTWGEDTATLLVRDSIARFGSGGVLEVLVATPAVEALRESEGPELHRRLALSLAPGDERRLFHWLSAGAWDQVPAESVCGAEAFLDAGKPDAARDVVQEGLRALVRRPDEEWEVRLLELDLAAALRVNTTAAIDLALHNLGIARTNPQIEQLEKIAQGALHVLGGEPERTLAETHLPEAADGVQTVMSALSVRMFAARTLGGRDLRRVLAESAPLGCALPDVRAQLDGERAWLAYRDGRFREAAEGHLEALQASSGIVDRSVRALNAASAYLEAGLLDRAQALALDALAVAAERRLAAHEARAAWVLRSAGYRRGDELSPDVDLALASARVGLSQLAGAVSLGEAVIAWRAHRPRLGHRLAQLAASMFVGESRRWSRLLARVVALLCASAPSESEAENLLAECEACPLDRIAIQTAGALYRTRTAISRPAGELVTARLPRIPTAERHLRREVMSVAEAMQSPMSCA